MKIVAVERLRIGERPNLVWVRSRTDAGITGLGDICYQGWCHELVDTSTR